MPHMRYACCILLLAAGCSSMETPKSLSTEAPTTQSIARVTPKATTLPSGVFNWNAIAMQTTKSGERRQFFRSPTATLDELEVHVTTLNPGQEPHPPHRHPHEEMMFVKEGTLEAHVEGQTIAMPTGSALFIAPMDLHNVKNVGDTKATYFVVTWKTPKTAPK
jgi:XRE family transcriptional regulator, regulator of sulfur utilization